MSTAKQPARKNPQPTQEVGPMYRCIRLHPYDGPPPSRFTREQIKAAVDAAFQKHADEIAGKTKT